LGCSPCSGELFVSCALAAEGLGRDKAELTYDSELAREKMWARIHLIPALQAEEDRDQVRRYLADKAREKELLGTETRVYHSDRYVLLVWRFKGTIDAALGSCARHSPSHLRTRPSRGWATGWRRCVGYGCTYMSRTKMRVEMAPFAAVPHRKMHDNQIYVFFGFMLRCYWFE
jgi:hypothetical protein